MASVYFDPAVGGDGSTVTDDSNPTTGLANGGHRARFVPALSNIVSVGNFALTKSNAASASAALAQSWAVQLGTPVSGGEYSAKYHAQAAAGSASSAGGSASSASSSASAAATSAADAATAAGYASTFLPSQSGNAGKLLSTDGFGPSWIAPPTPVGAVVAFAGSAAPAGWLLCDGSTVSRTTYAALFSAIGTVYGAGDGATTFKLPDLRGEFVRGLDGGRGVDTGRTLGSAQSSQNLSHSHGGATTGSGMHEHVGSNSNTTGGNPPPYTTQPYLIPDTLYPNTATASQSGSHSHSISADGGAESRPRNVAMNYIIKT